MVPTRAVEIVNVLHYTKRMRVVTLADRRTIPPSAPQEWLFQSDLEDVLYPDALTLGTTGAFYRLLRRSEAGNGASLPLRRNCAGEQGLVTDAEFDTMKALLHSGVRAFTLVPIQAVAMALASYGPTPASEALLSAFALPRPAAWLAVEGVGVPPEDDEAEVEVDAESGDEEEDQGADGAGGGGASDGGEEGEDDDDEEGADEDEDEDEDDEEDEEADGDEEEDSDEGDEEGEEGGEDEGSDGTGGSGAAGGGQGDDDPPSTEDEAEATDVERPTKRPRVAPLEVSPALEAQLAAYVGWRVMPVNRQRKGKAVEAITANRDRRSILLFFAWLQKEKGVAAPTFGLFASSRIGAAVQAFIGAKCKTCKSAHVANIVGSLVWVARFTHALNAAKAAPGTVVSSTPLDELVALHAQVLGTARQEALVRARMLAHAVAFPQLPHTRMRPHACSLP
jgi:hypothetical protein